MDERGRKALVVIMNTEDNSSAHAMEQAIQKAAEAEVVVFAIGLSSHTKYSLDQVAKRTRGRTFIAEGYLGLQRAYALISEILQSQCEITYTTNNMDVELKDRCVVVTVTHDLLTAEVEATHSTASTSVEDPKGSAQPSRCALPQNLFDPVNPVTLIRYDLPEASHVRLDA
jgi:hypothetical protein